MAAEATVTVAVIVTTAPHILFKTRLETIHLAKLQRYIFSFLLLHKVSLYPIKHVLKKQFKNAFFGPIRHAMNKKL